MKLDRLGAFHQTRLSFVRSLMRKVMDEQWQITRTRWDLDDAGFGTAIYRVVATAGERYSAVFFANYIPDEKRTDRVIAEEWDVAFVLCAGDVTEAQVDELRLNVPKQEVGRYLPYVLVLSRANKSTRNFSHVVDCLSRGVQPDPATLGKVGYLYRTTAVYGNGKFGIADFDRLRQTKAFDVTFRAQMFAVWMMRHFSVEQAHHLARLQGGDKSADLHREIQRYLGVGNATGLGMAPFLVTHPILLNQWIETRETAIALVIKQGAITDLHWQRFIDLMHRAHQHVSEIETIHQLQQQRNATMLAELHRFLTAQPEAAQPANWAALLADLADWSAEAQEVVHSIMLELYPDLVNPLAEQLNTNVEQRLDPTMRLDVLCQLLEKNYSWALDLDFAEREQVRRFWYSSADKEEPRFGDRFKEMGADKERPLTMGRDVCRLQQLISDCLAQNKEACVIDLLLAHPAQRAIVRRVQSLAERPYGEIWDNLIAADTLPIHMLRCKLSFFGASKFDPRSNLWVRVTLFQGAPLVDEIGKPFADDWFWPTAPVFA
ncbi:MAG: hypothetical protein ACPG8W_05495 [Candidatus Promineifilaceae bacterium]